MTPAKYPVAMEACRWAYLIRAGLMGPAIRERWSIVVASQNIIFFRPLRLFQRYTVDCRLIHGGDGWLYFEQKIRTRGRLAATGLFRMRIKRGGDTLFVGELARIAGYEKPRLDAPAMLRAWNGVSEALLDEKREEEARVDRGRS
jgi:hypothetical protein